MISLEDFKAFEFFKGFTDGQLEELAKIAAEETFEAGAQLYKIGEQAKSLILVREGKALIMMENSLGPHKPPLQVTIEVVTKGEVMGWGAVMEPHVHALNALCIDRIQAFTLNGQALRNLINADPGFGYAMMKSTAKLMAMRLSHTRTILVGERMLSSMDENY